MLRNTTKPATATRAGNSEAAVPDVVAIIQTFNEQLILRATLDHLTQQGIGVHILENSSTDETASIALSFLGKGVLGVERFPDTDTPTEYDLKASMRRKTELALQFARRGAQWIIHYDADEIRESPWPGVSLREGLHRVAQLGYNTIDHVLIDFVPTDEGFVEGISPTSHFTHYLPSTCTTRHGKAWIQGPKPVDLATHGGHFVKFRGRKVFPIPFIIKHYPILSTAHGRRKVLRERKPRYARAAVAHGWHTHYNHIQDERHQFLYAADDPRLVRYDDAGFKQDLLLRHPMPAPGLLKRIFS